MANELVIKINGDIKDFKGALERAQGETEAFSGQLESMAKASAVAFAALTAGIGLSVKAFGESQAASNELTQAMQNAGVYSDELKNKYADQAKEIQRLTGIDDDAVISAKATMQAMIGQTEITEDLTKAMADLSVGKKMDLNSTAELISKGINGQTAGLKKLGIEIDESLTKEQRIVAITEQVNRKYGDMAAAANKGLGGVKGLNSAFGGFMEAIGERFAPLFERIIVSMTKFFLTISENKPLMDFISSALIAGTVVSGLGVILGTAGVLFLKLKAAMTAAGIATTAMSVSMKALVGATGLGLLVLLAAEIYLNWNTIWPRMQAVFQAFVNNISSLGYALGKILSGAVTLDLSKVKEGLSDAKSAIMQGYGEYETLTTNHQREIAAIEDKARKDEESKNKTHVAELADVQVEGAKEVSKEKKEILKTDEEIYKEHIDKMATELGNILGKVTSFISIVFDQAQAEKDLAEFTAEIPVKLQELQANNQAAIDKFQGKIADELEKAEKAARKRGDSEEEIQIMLAEKRAELDEEMLTLQRELDTGLIEDQYKLEEELAAKQKETQEKAQQAAADMVGGIAGTITDVFLPGMGSAVQGLLTQLAQGSEFLSEAFTSIMTQIPTIFQNIGDAVNGLLDTFIARAPEFIDKLLEGVISLMNRLPEIINKLREMMPGIAIKFMQQLIADAPKMLISMGKSMAEGFINGVIGGFELIINGLIGILNELPFVDLKKVTLPRVKLAEGGDVTGGIAGRDSVPAMLMPGELVVPTRSYEEVIGSVRAARAAERVNRGSGAGGQQRLIIGFDGREASQVLTVRQNEDRALGISQEQTG